MGGLVALLALHTERRWCLGHQAVGGSKERSQKESSLFWPVSACRGHLSTSAEATWRSVATQPLREQHGCRRGKGQRERQHRQRYGKGM